MYPNILVGYDTNMCVCLYGWQMVRQEIRAHNNKLEEQERKKRIKEFKSGKI